MISFRVRQYGFSDWIEISVQDSEDSEDEFGLSQILAARIENALDQEGLHVQKLSEEGIWEDLE